MSNGACLNEVTIIIFSQLQPFVLEVSRVDERMMQVSLKCILDFISLVALYAERNKTEVFANLTLEKTSAPLERFFFLMLLLPLTNVGYELCVCPHGSGLTAEIFKI